MYELWLKTEWPMLFDMNDKEQDIYFDTLSKDEKILLANNLLNHAEHCLDNIKDSVGSMK